MLPMRFRVLDPSSGRGEADEAIVPEMAAVRATSYHRPGKSDLAKSSVVAF